MSNQSQPYTNTIPVSKPKVVDMCIHDFMVQQFPAKSKFLGNWLTSQSLAMIHAYRGVGKSHVALGIAYAVASGTSFLGWEAGEGPKKVLYIDGEMPGVDLQTRLKGLIDLDETDGPEPGYLRVINGSLWDEQGLYMPDLAMEEGQKEIDEHIGDAELIIVDNLSCLVRGNGNDSDPMNWQSANLWSIGLRRQKKAVIFVHHSGKNGTQRGSSKKEDAFDIIIKLEHPFDYSPDLGAKFEVHFEKTGRAENLGDLAKPFEAWLKSTGWEMKDLEKSIEEKVITFAKEKYTQSEICAVLDLEKYMVSRIFKKHGIKSRPSKDEDDIKW